MTAGCQGFDRDIEMKNTRLAVLMIAGALLVAGSSLGSANAAVLERTRTGEHGSFTRLVFEFQDAPAGIPLESVSEGNLSVLFPGTRTNLPPVVRFGRPKRLDRVEFFQRGSDLFANIIPKLPRFNVKTLRLKDPERVVFDLYWIPQAQPGSFSEVGGQRKEVFPIRGASTPLRETGRAFIGDLPQEETQETRSERAHPEDEDVSDSEDSILMSYMRYGLWQTFFLAVLNFLTLIVIMMLGLMLSRQIKRVDVQEQEEDRPQQERDEDRRLMLIDAGIKKRLRRYHQAKAA